MRWMLLCLALAACGGDDDSTADLPDTGACMVLFETPAGSGNLFCNQCGQPTDAGTCRLGSSDTYAPCYYDPHCGSWGDAAPR